MRNEPLATPQSADDPSPHSDAELVGDVASVQSGTPFTVALRMTMEEGWHSYWTNPGDSGQPTSIGWALPEGFVAGDMQALQEKYTEQDVVWLSIVSSAEGKQGYYPPEEINAKNAEHDGEQTAILMNTSGEVGRMYGARTTPHMYIINPEGTLIYKGGIDDKPPVPSRAGGLSFRWKPRHRIKRLAAPYGPNEIDPAYARKHPVNDQDIKRGIGTQRLQRVLCGAHHGEGTALHAFTQNTARQSGLGRRRLRQ